MESVEDIRDKYWDDLDDFNGTFGAIGYSSEASALPFHSYIGHDLEGESGGNVSSHCGLENSFFENEHKDNQSTDSTAFLLKDLKLESALEVGGSVEAPNVDDDPFAFLEAEIEADKPKTNSTPEWEKMMAAVKSEQSEPNYVSLVEENETIMESSQIELCPSSLNGSHDDMSPPSGDKHSSTINDDRKSRTPSDDRTHVSEEDMNLEEGRDCKLNSTAVDVDGMRILMEDLMQKLESSDPRGLQSCLNYVLFPLSIALDAIAGFRGSGLDAAGADNRSDVAMLKDVAAVSNSTEFPKKGSSIDIDDGAANAMPVMKSDKLAEMVIQITLLLMQRCCLERPEQLMGLLQRLYMILSAPNKNVSEELRLGSLQIACASLVGARSEQESSISEIFQSEAAAPFVGLFSSTLLQCVSAEDELGSMGSTSVQEYALKALRLFVDVVHSADALSFFLPGLATGLARFLSLNNAQYTIGKKRPSGCVSEGLSALATVLERTLGDAVVADILSDRDGNVPHMTSIRCLEDVRDADAVLNELRTLESIACTKSLEYGDVRSSEAKPNNKDNDLKTPESPIESQIESHRLRVDRTPAWIHESAGRVSQLLEIVLPSLAKNDSLPVKLAVLNACGIILTKCQEALHSCRKFCLDIVLVLAQDEWLEVQEQAKKIIVSKSSTGTSLGPSYAMAEHSTPRDAVSSIQQSMQTSLRIWLQGFPDALRKGDADGRTYALKLKTCLEAIQPADVVSLLLPNYSRTSEVAEVLCQSVVLDREIAKLLLFTATEPIGSFAKAPLSTTERIPLMDQTPTQIVDENKDALFTERKEECRIDTQQTCYVRDKKRYRSVGALLDSPVLLPRMAAGLQYISTRKTWNAVVNVFRCLGALAFAADQSALRRRRQSVSTEGTSRNMNPLVGSALRALIDALLQRFQQQVEIGLGSDDAGSRVSRRQLKRREKKGLRQYERFEDLNDDLPQSCWQLEATQTIVVISEILCGVSLSPMDLDTRGSVQGTEQSNDQPGGASALKSSGDSTTAYENYLRCLRREIGEGDTSSGNHRKDVQHVIRSLIIVVLDKALNARILELPTSASSDLEVDSFRMSEFQSISADISCRDSRMILTRGNTVSGSFHDRGCNVLLQRAILEFIGACARFLGPTFTLDGRLMRTILLPVLEKLSDPAVAVSGAAKAAISSICGFCGYTDSGLRQLITDNADYIIDGLCRRLRQPEMYPSAPMLFAAVLGHSGVAPALIPMMAEPAHQTLQGISIIARRKKPEHIVPFLLCLREISKGTKVVVKEISGQMNDIAKEIRRKSQVSASKWIEEHAVLDEDDDGDDSGDGIDIENIAKYFYRQCGSWSKSSTESDEDDLSKSSMSEQLEEARKVSLDQDEWNLIQTIQSRNASMGLLCESAIACCAPLLLSSSLKAATQAVQTCLEALIALKQANKCMDLYKKNLSHIIKPPGGIVSLPSKSKDPLFFPSVHLLWHPLMAALDDWRAPLVENALELLAKIALLAGDFVLQRFQKDAVPRIQRLIKAGPSKQRLLAPGQDDLTAPGAIQRIQRAALLNVREIASGPVEMSALLSSPIAGDILYTICDVIGGNQPAPVREAATSAFIAVAGIDCDLAAALLATALWTKGTSPNESILSCCKSSLESDRDTSIELPSPFVGFRDMFSHAPSRELLPDGLRNCNDAKLQAMAKQLCCKPIKWHKKIDTLLNRL